MKLDAKLSTIELEYRSDPLNRLSTTEPLRLLLTDTKYLDPESRKPLRRALVRASHSAVRQSGKMLNGSAQQGPLTIVDRFVDRSGSASEHPIA